MEGVNITLTLGEKGKWKEYLVNYGITISLL